LKAPATASDAARTNSRDGAGVPLALLAALLYLGLAGSIPRRVNFAVGTFFAGLIVAFVVAAFGWRRLRELVPIPVFLHASVACGAWAMIAGVAAWQFHSVYEAGKFAVWMAFIIPGLAAFLATRRIRNTLLLGWTAGVDFYVVGAGLRIGRGRPVLDVLSTNALKLMGVNRNGVNIIVLFIVPFLIAGAGGRTSLGTALFIPMAVAAGVAYAAHQARDPSTVTADAQADQTGPLARHPGAS
jgi:hypothetical protein